MNRPSKGVRFAATSTSPCAGACECRVYGGPTRRWNGSTGLSRRSSAKVCVRRAKHEDGQCAGPGKRDGSIRRASAVPSSCETAGGSELGIRSQVQWLPGARNRERWPCDADVFGRRMISWIDFQFWQKRLKSFGRDDHRWRTCSADQPVDHHSCTPELRRAGAPLQFYAFDVLTLAGRSPQDRPLEERRKVLRTNVLPKCPIRFPFRKSLEATASEATEAVKAQGLFAETLLRPGLTLPCRSASSFAQETGRAGGVSWLASKTLFRPTK
jgi:hypothetical protein